jgi:hypothetical protein
LTKEFPSVVFERYADDVILHCNSNQQAQMVLGKITQRLAQVGLEINPDKTRIVYCKDSNREGSYEHQRFDFLGYTFRPRLARNSGGGFFVSFCPAVADDAAKMIRRQIKRWRLHMWVRENPIRHRTINESIRARHRAIQWMVDPIEDGGLGLDPATVAEIVGHDDGGYLIATVYTKLGRRRALERAQRAMKEYERRQAPPRLPDACTSSRRPSDPEREV